MIYLKVSRVVLSSTFCDAIASVSSACRPSAQMD